jgi:hypothetical protein
MEEYDGSPRPEQGSEGNDDDDGLDSEREHSPVLHTRADGAADLRGFGGSRQSGWTNGGPAAREHGHRSLGSVGQTVHTTVAPVPRIKQKPQLEPATQSVSESGSKASQADGLAHETMEEMSAVHDASEFAYRFVFQRPRNEDDARGPPVGADDNAKREYVTRSIADATRAIDFWFRTWPAALHIALAWLGDAHHLKNTDSSGPNKGRARWHLIALAAAVHMNTLGESRSHKFVREVWDITMKDRNVEKRYWNYRTGTVDKHWAPQVLSSVTKSWVQWAPDTCTRARAHTNKHRVPLERVMDDKFKANASSTSSRFVASTRKFLHDALFFGDLQKQAAPWTKATLLGPDHGDCGPWYGDKQAERFCADDLHPSQRDFLSSVAFVVYSVGINTAYATLQTKTM